MNISEKITELVDFAGKITSSQRIIFSSEGNLKEPKDIDREYQSNKRDKPNGLWFSVGNGWIDYLKEGCENNWEDANWYRTRLLWYTHIYEINLDYDKVLKIHTEKKFEAFLEKFKTKTCINWKEVAKKWSGIEILFSNFLPDKDNFLYDQWDCDSGCVWKPDAVKEINLLKFWNITFESQNLSTINRQKQKAG